MPRGPLPRPPPPTVPPVPPHRGGHGPHNDQHRSERGHRDQRAPAGGGQSGAPRRRGGRPTLRTGTGPRRQNHPLRKTVPRSGTPDRPVPPVVRRHRITGRYGRDRVPTPGRTARQNQQHNEQRRDKPAGARTPRPPRRTVGKCVHGALLTGGDIRFAASTVQQSHRSRAVARGPPPPRSPVFSTRQWPAGGRTRDAHGPARSLDGRARLESFSS